jgi:hypothetical protein
VRLAPSESFGKPMRTILIASLITLVTQVGIFIPIKAFSGSHALEISLQNCDYAKQVALTIMKKKNSSRLLNYYQELDFSSPAIMEIVFDAYDLDQAEDEFANKWYNNCAEFSCSDFWAGLDAALAMISDD